MEHQEVPGRDRGRSDRREGLGLRSYVHLLKAAIKCRVTLSAPVSNVQNIKKEVGVRAKSALPLMLLVQVGPVSLTYEIPMYNVSNLQARLAACSSAESIRGEGVGARRLLKVSEIRGSAASPWAAISSVFSLLASPVMVRVCNVLRLGVYTRFGSGNRRS